MIAAPALSPPTYLIDADDRIITLTGSWPDLLAAFTNVIPQTCLIAGQPVWDYVQDETARELLKALYQRVRAASRSVFIPIRSDTSIARRLFEIELRPHADQSIEHVAWPVWSETRRRVHWLDPVLPRDASTYPFCGACMRINVADKFWQEVEEAQLALLPAKPRSVPRLHATVCPGCRQSILQTLSFG